MIMKNKIKLLASFHVFLLSWMLYDKLFCAHQLVHRYGYTMHKVFECTNIDTILLLVDLLIVYLELAISFVHLPWMAERPEMGCYQTHNPSHFLEEFFKK